MGRKEFLKVLKNTKEKYYFETTDYLNLFFDLVSLFVFSILAGSIIASPAMALTLVLAWLYNISENAQFSILIVGTMFTAGFLFVWKARDYLDITFNSTKRVYVKKERLLRALESDKE